MGCADVMRPNVAVPNCDPGFKKFAWLKTLKDSTRSWNAASL